MAIFESPNILGSGFGRTDFLRIFIFGPPDFFADFLAGFFLLIFVGKVPRKILQENPRENPPKFIQQKSSDTFLQNGRGKIYFSEAKERSSQVQAPDLDISELKNMQSATPYSHY